LEIKVKQSTLLLLAMLVAGCSGGGGSAGLPLDAYDAQVDAVADTVTATEYLLPGATPDAGPNPSPDKLKPGDKCPNFLGSLPCASGDGLRRCTRCGGDGRMDKEDIEMTNGQFKRVISLYAAKSDAGDSSWPLKWYRDEAPKLIATNIEVRLIAQPAGKPYLEICDGPICEIFHDYTSADAILKKFDDL